MPRKRTNEEFESLLKEKNPTIIPLEKYVKKDEKILCRCSVCAHEWKVTPGSIIRGSGCPNCSAKRLSRERLRSDEEFKKIVYSKNKNIKILNEYTGLNSLLKCECLECGNSWEIIVKNLTGCKKCGYARVSDLLKKTNENFIEELKNKNDMVEPMEEYKGDKEKIIFECKKCKKNFFGTPHDVLEGHGCPFCKMSSGEKRIEKILSDNNVKYEVQYKFEDCKNVFKLPFDFYLKELNICIEYDGEQHFYPVTFGATEEQAQKNFELTKKRDLIKTQYCEENNIKLIRIPYTEYNNIFNILKEHSIVF